MRQNGPGRRGLRWHWNNARVYYRCWREIRRRRANGARLRHWDWPETEHPSIGGWADREKL